MPRALWKGAISFGLVHVPVSLYPATRSEGMSFDMLDKRDFAPVGYKRYNKRSGEEVPWNEIVKGYEYEQGQYVVVGEEDFKQANVKATQTVEILSFVDADAVAPYYFETPYYLEPGKRGEKGYALLRDVLIRTRRIGIAQVVIRSRQHLAALLPVDRMLVLNTLRYASEIRDTGELALPEAGKASGISDKELQMAERLVADMSEAWKPAQYKDTYHDDLMKRIEEKIDSGQTHVVTPEGEEPAEAPQSAEVIDLAALLRRSLERKTGRGTGETRDEGEETGRQRRAAAGKSVSTKTASTPRRSGTHRKRA
jgi:DNA end-binding protein Ku